MIYFVDGKKMDLQYIQYMERKKNHFTCKKELPWWDSIGVKHCGNTTLPLSI